jgi:hypothetical protein
VRKEAQACVVQMMRSHRDLLPSALSLETQSDFALTFSVSAMQNHCPALAWSQTCPSFTRTLSRSGPSLLIEWRTKGNKGQYWEVCALRQLLPPVSIFATHCALFVFSIRLTKLGA